MDLIFGPKLDYGSHSTESIFTGLTNLSNRVSEIGVIPYGLPGKSRLKRRFSFRLFIGHFSIVGLDLSDFCSSKT